jgi:predicted glycosyltransferase
MRYSVAIARRLRSSGHQFILTTREHPDTVGLARILGEKPIVVGKYQPNSLASRLEESASRIIQFSKMFKDNPPDLAIAHQSVELCRTAFGLGIPLILTADTPRAKAVNRLTIPLASTLVVSEALPKSFVRSYCPESVVWFKGVDEVAWIKGLKAPQNLDVKKPLIVVRQLETRAAYALEVNDPSVVLAKQLEALGNVLLLKRYNESGEEFACKSNFVDSASLVASADLVVSAGGTISREAALQGVPSLVASEVGKTYVNTYLARKGFPIFLTSAEKVFSLAKHYLGKRFDVADKLEQLENPVDIIEKLVLNHKSKLKA